MLDYVKLLYGRALDRCCPCFLRSTDENINFATQYERFADDDDDNGIELQDLYGTDDKDKMANDGQDRKNKITEWQAGWNVTNSIQVSADHT